MLTHTGTHTLLPTSGTRGPFCSRMGVATYSPPCPLSQAIVLELKASVVPTLGWGREKQEPGHT